MKFNPRLTAPSSNNKYYNSSINPFVSAGYGMFQNGGNCTCYAYGRFMEESDVTSCNLSTANAEIWYGKNDGYSRGQTPKLGAVICWEGIGSLAGHVAIVEKIESDGTITTSNSGWRSTLFYLSRIKPPYNIGSKYKFQGFIYNPTNFDEEYTPSGNETIKNIQTTLNNRYNTGLVVDGIYGNATHKAMVIGLQTELNKQCGARLVIDGIFGNATKSACPNLRVGMSGNITWLVQAMLVIKGYSLSIDGIYGNDTKNKVHQFQSNNGLTPDGICGKNTFKTLFK